MKISDIKIGTQLKLGFGIILFCGVILSFTSYRHTRQITAELTRLYNHPLQVRRALGVLESDILLIHRGMKDLIMESDSKDIEQIKSEIELYKESAFKQIDILYSRYLGPKSDIDSVHSCFVKWNAVREETIRLLNSGRVQEAYERTNRNGAGGRFVDKISAHLKKVDNFAILKGDELYSNSITLSRALNVKLIVLVLVIFIFSFVIIYLLIKNIKQPLNELINATKLFREGDQGARSSFKSENEFGYLSDSYNALADNIEIESKLTNKISALSGEMLIHEDAHMFCHSLLRSLLINTGAQMGAVYLINAEKTFYERFESIGLEEKGTKHFSAKSNEGEVGLASSSRVIQHIKNISEESHFSYPAISGKFRPSEIITVPVIVEDDVVGVISLCTVSSFSQESVTLINRISDILNARMGGILAYGKIVKISGILEQQNTELETQKDELTQMTNELTEQNRELEVQKRQLDEASRLKTSFLSNMSHELRTPLNSIIALSGVLSRRLDNKIPQEEFGYLDIITKNGKQLLDLINDILDIARIESGRVEIRLSSFDVNDLVKEITDLVHPLAQQKSITLKFTGSDNKIGLISDYNKCRHIVQNIISNAVKFTESGEVAIKTELRGEFARVSVQDSGIGISKEHLPYIFDEFRQADSGNTKKYGGSGLGLAIAKKSANLIGADIRVKSKIGEGSLFIVDIPLNYFDEKQNDVVEHSYPEIQSAKLSSYNTRPGVINSSVLIVEDTDASIIQLRDILEEEGYTIEVAHNGAEALDKIGQKIPDAVVLDLMMPEMDGFEALRRIRSMDKTSKLPVLILTAKYLSKEELSFLKHNNVQQLIRKGNISKEDLLNAISELVKISKSEI
ncbi:MAG: ATP-binding protein [Bacteroidales bacterium]